MTLRQTTPFLVVVATCIFLLLLKWPSLDLPHYWDEAFPYSYAIGHMTEHGPGIRSDAAPAIYTTGHPLLYYFLQASWNNLTGNTMWLQRLLPLCLSFGCLWMTFLLGRKLFRDEIGMAACGVLVCQNTFLAQSSFQLPETLLTFLMLTTLYFYVRGHRTALLISATLLLFTKETAVVLLMGVFAHHFFIQLSGQTFRSRMLQTWMYVLPVALNLFFYLDQYVIQGWFLFPRHLGFLTLTTDFFFNQLSRYFSYLFLYYGRNGLFFLAIIALTWLLIRNRASIAPKGKQALLLVLPLVAFLLFSAVNFYSNRYILCLFPLFALLVSAGLFYALEHYHRLWFPSVTAIASAVCLYFSITKQSGSDHTLGYVHAVLTQQQATAYLLEHVDQKTSVATSFLMSKNLTSHHPGYLEKSQVFGQVTQELASAQVAVFCSNEVYFKPEDLSAWNLEKRFESGRAWCEIYTR